MSNGFRTYAAGLLTAVSLTLAGCGGGQQRASDGSATNGSYGVASPDTAGRHHHSKLAGAAVGAAAGHMLGHHAVAGAVVGALVQHERNKHER